MTKETNNIITIDGKNYKTDDMNTQQKYIIAQIKNLQNKVNSLRFELDQVVRAQNSFTNALIDSVNSTETETKDKKAS
jgi:prefoldin subunit 5